MYKLNPNPTPFLHQTYGQGSDVYSTNYWAKNVYLLVSGACCIQDFPWGQPTLKDKIVKCVSPLA